MSEHEAHGRGSAPAMPVGHLGHLSREGIAALIDEPTIPPEIAAHLDRCAHCGEEFGRMSRMRMALSACAELDPPAGEWDRILGRLEAAGMSAGGRAGATDAAGSGSVPSNAAGSWRAGLLRAAAVAVLFAGGMLAGSRVAVGPRGPEAPGDRGSIDRAGGTGPVTSADADRGAGLAAGRDGTARPDEGPRGVDPGIDLVSRGAGPVDGPAGTGDAATPGSMAVDAVGSGFDPGRRAGGAPGAMAEVAGEAGLGTDLALDIQDDPTGGRALESPVARKYVRLVADLANLRVAAGTGDDVSDPAALAERLARLDALAEVTRDALERAPGDPVLNNLLFEVAEARSQVSTRLGESLHLATLEVR